MQFVTCMALAVILYTALIANIRPVTRNWSGGGGGIFNKGAKNFSFTTKTYKRFSSVSCSL